MKISVVTPFYEGDRYMQDYVSCMEKNREMLAQAGHELEVILVNDSPWKTLKAPANGGQYFRVLTNSENRGIHYSRVSGLTEATGEYVMFLDQDDLLAEDGLLRLMQVAIKNPSDIIIGNANLGQVDGSNLVWYRTADHVKLIWDLQTYLNVGIQIISPGQCLIKKDAVPQFWKEHFVRVNGADDYYLWLLMMAAGKTHSFCGGSPIYNHRFTGDNISADTTATDDSVYDFLELLSECDYFKQEDIFRLHEMITYKAQFRKSNLFGKLTCTIANLDIFIANLKFKKVTKTGYGFNR